MPELEYPLRNRVCICFGQLQETIGRSRRVDAAVGGKTYRDDGTEVCDPATSVEALYLLDIQRNARPIRRQAKYPRTERAFSRIRAECYVQGRKYDTKQQPVCNFFLALCTAPSNLYLYSSILNVCMAYSSTDEITTAVESSVQIALAKDDPFVLPSPIVHSLKKRFGRKITIEDIDSQLMTSLVGSPPLDILIRSSGVNRLSDFLLWQVRLPSIRLSPALKVIILQCCENTQIHICKAYWPDFGLFDFIPIILDFQRKSWSRQR
jgi:hypothetical protein